MVAPILIMMNVNEYKGANYKRLQLLISYHIFRKIKLVKFNKKIIV